MSAFAVWPPLTALRQASYSQSVQCRRMNWDGSNPYEYHPERGIYFHEVFPRVICGSQPRTAEDISLLHDQVRPACSEVMYKLHLGGLAVHDHHYYQSFRGSGIQLIPLGSAGRSGGHCEPAAG